MLIAILVLLGLAGAIWYFARKQAQAVVTLTQEDVNVTNSTNESAFTTPEVVAEKEAVPAQKEATDEIKVSIIETPVVETPVTEAKPKKKRRYYPKKK